MNNYSTFSPQVDDPLPETIAETKEHIEMLQTQVYAIDRQILRKELADEVTDDWLYKAYDSRHYKQLRITKLHWHLWELINDVPLNFMDVVEEHVSPEQFKEWERMAHG